MLINIENLKEFLKKATMNYYIENVRVSFDVEKDVVWTRMRSYTNHAATIIKIKNNIFKDVKEDIEMNFSSTKGELRPFLDLIDEEEVDFKLFDNKVILGNKLKLHFDDPMSISFLESEGPLKSLEYFINMPLKEDFFDKFNKIKKIGNRFNKVYFTIKDSILYIEATDKLNLYSNGISFEISKVDYADTFFCFDFISIKNFFDVVDENFTLKLAGVDEGGLLQAGNEDDSESYFLMSLID